jgi:hypothetical protein
VGLLLHPVWLIFMLFVVGIPLALVLAIVAGLRRSGPSQPSAAYGLRSPDGEWWWDGRQWQRVPPPNSDP